MSALKDRITWSRKGQALVDDDVPLEPDALAEPDHVEPVPPPALAVVGRGEKAVDQPLVGDGRRVGNERIDLLGRRREARQVVGDPPDQRPPIGRRRGTQAFLEQLHQDKPIDRVVRPGVRRSLRRERGAGWLDVGERAERPPGGVGPGLLLDDVAVRPHGPFDDPAPEHGDLSGRQRLSLLGHLRPLVRARRGDQVEQPALIGLAGDDVGAGLQVVEGRQRELPLGDAGLVAADTVPLEDRRHVTAEVDRSVGHGERGTCEQCQDQERAGSSPTILERSPVGQIGTVRVQGGIRGAGRRGARLPSSCLAQPVSIKMFALSASIVTMGTPGL